MAKKSEKRFGQINVGDEPRNERETTFTFNTAKDRSKELTNHGQPSFHEGEDLLSSFLPKASITAPAKFEKDTNTLNITLEDCSIILVGQSNTEQVTSDHYCDRDRLQCENSPKEPNSDDRCDRQKRVREKVECHLQVFNKGEVISDSDPKGADCVELPMALIQVQGDLSGKRYSSERLQKVLESLQDNGKFDEHGSIITKAKLYYEERGNADMLLVLEIEQAAPLSYKGHGKPARKKLKSVIKSDLMSQALHPDIITGRAYFLLAADMRRDKKRRNLKFPTILECLRRSECLLKSYDSPEDLSELYQTFGAVWLDRMSQIPNDERNARARNAAGEKAKYYLEKAIDYGKQDHRPRVQTKRQMYAHHKLATILLDSCSPFALAQEKTIPSSDIKEAENHLDNIFKLGCSIPKATLMLLYKTQSDQFNRLGQYQLAKERAEDAYEIARLHQFNTELEPLQKRIDLLEQKLQTLNHIVNEVHDQSSSDTGYRTSGDDSQ